ncbi:MAG TPA: flagellar export protein FliJ [Solirubrobacteraceae bacterium]|nr:flagellar export protein FliJ [Solirubrobacteraceae bacterium]
MTGPSFRFRLERVRAVRERKETLAQQELARSISRLGDTRERLRDAEQELERARAEQRDAASGRSTMGAAELQSRQAFLERVEQLAGERARDVTRVEADVADRNAELVVAAGEHEMLKRLRARRRSEHERESARRESKILDEMASSRSRRSVA